MRPIYMRKLAQVRAGRYTSEVPFRIFLTFEEVSGPGQYKPGREGTASLSYLDIASILGAIPALEIKEDEDIWAMGRVLDMLRQLNAGSPSASDSHG